MPQPDLILTPFAQDAPPSAVDNIPEVRSPSDPLEKATWTQGFPGLTMIPLAAGGIPPRGQDVNGVLRAISEHTVFQGGGGQYKWSAELVAAAGGYAKGAVVQSDDGLFSCVSAIDGNTVNFNTSPGSIGTQWLLWTGNGKASSNITITAGLGLSGGGDLTTNRTLSVVYGTTSGTAASGNDSRITGAAQKADNLSDLASVSAARQNLGLGTAATRDVVSSEIDQTAGALVDTSWMGIAGYLPPTLERLKGSRFLSSGVLQNGLVGNFLSTQVSAQSNDSGLLLIGESAYAGRAYLATNFGEHTSDINDIQFTELVSSLNLMQSTGQSTGYPMTQKAVTDALIGVGQTWVDVTAQRATLTNYTNTTGKPIVVSIFNDATGTFDAITVDGVVALQALDGVSAFSGTAIVPAGSVYRFNAAAEGSLYWAELR